MLFLATDHAMVGRNTDAVASLERYLGMPDPHDAAFVEADPRFDSLREDPAFRDILVRHGAP